MNPFFDFLLKNFFLFCLSLGVIFMVLRSYRTKRIVILMPILVVSVSILLSIIYFIEMQTQKNPDLVFLSTLCCSLGFIFRLFILYFFMRMIINDKTVLFVAHILLGINTLVYLIPLLLFWPGITHLVFYYENGVVIRAPLFYTSHVIGAIMMVYFIIYALSSLKGRRRYDALACLICAVFILIAVILETYLVAEYLLNTTVAISCLFYIVHLYQQASIRDALTGLLDRKAFYADLAKIESKVTSIIAIDMNSLKYINDHEGHAAGDNALKTISEMILKSMDSKKMDAYRMGGDEFIILSYSSREVAVVNTVTNLKLAMSQTKYSVAIGYASKNEFITDVSKMVKAAEEMMYKDKSEYYKKSGIERRKA